MKNTITLEELVKDFELTPEEAIAVMLTIENSNSRYIMEDLDSLNIPGCYGVESVSCNGEWIAYYLNTGDTYSTTIAITADGELLLTTWGDLYEEEEARLFEEEGLISCGYCGEYTPCAEEWRDTVCEHCGRYVQDGTLPDKTA